MIVFFEVGIESNELTLIKLFLVLIRIALYLHMS